MTLNKCSVSLLKKVRAGEIEEGAEAGEASAVAKEATGNQAVLER